MRSLVHPWTAAVLCTCASVGHTAEEPPELGTVVRGERGPEATPDSVDVVETERWTDSGRPVSGVLESVPGVTLRRAGASRGFTSIMIRGLSGRSVGVVLDEVPLSSATLTPVDLSLFDLDELESVEVYRGSGPVRFPTPLGGLLRLRSATRPSNASRVHTGLGAFGEKRLNATLSRAAPKHAWTLRVGGLRGELDYPYYDDGGTFFTELDDSVRRRENNAQDRVSARASLRLPRQSGSAEIWSWIVAREQKVPGPGSARDLRAESRDAQALVRLSRKKWRIGEQTLSFGSDVLASARELKDPDRRLGLGTQSSEQTLVQVAADGRLQARLAETHRLDGTIRLSAYRYRIQSEPRLALDERAADRDSIAIGSGFEWSVGLGDRLDAYLRLRGDAESLGEESLAQLSPSAGATWAVGPCLLRGLAGRRHRLPTLLERYGDNVLTVANPALRAESATSADLGARCGNKTRWFELSAYRVNADELIALVQNSQRSVRAENLEAARINGLEALGVAEIGSARLRAAYTLTDGREGRAGANAPIPGVPTHRLNLTASVELGRARLSWVSDFASERNLASSGLRPVPGRVLHDAFVRVDLNGRFVINASVFNVTNQIENTLNVPGASQPVTAGLSDFLSYPLAGRTVYLGLTLRSS